MKGWKMEPRNILRFCLCIRACVFLRESLGLLTRIQYQMNKLCVFEREKESVRFLLPSSHVPHLSPLFWSLRGAVSVWGNDSGF